jgi:acyl-CoA synthetase (AMP-forming)/AMP-acid ligase II
MHLEVLRDAFDAFGYKLAEIYGQGESPMTITAMSKEMHAHLDRSGCEERLAAVGIPQPMVEVDIVDDQGHRLPPGQVGEIAVRGDTVMAGYWMDAEATAKTIVDGWLYTGDCGCFDDRGLLYLKDRTKDVIISGGTNIYTREVEDALLSHPGVYEAAVIGAPDPEWGEVVVAFVVTRDGHQLDDQGLDRHCLERMARFKRPRMYHFLDELPKNAYGKIVKTSLRETANTGQPAV